MRILLYILLAAAGITVLMMIYNRLYYEWQLAHALKKLNKELKKATQEEINSFVKEMRDVLNGVIDAMTESYDEFAQELAQQTKE